MKSKHRPTIGFLVDDLFDGFECPIWLGAIEASRLLDVNLISYAGGLLDNWYSTNAYRLVNTGHVDGIIAITGTIGSHSSDSEIAEFLKLFSSLPMVTISRPVEGCHNILVDNESGIRELMDHLIRDHGCRRIAFVGGPESNTEAAVRLKAYRDSLDHHGIPYEPEMVYYGNFWDCGVRAAQTLLDERKLQFDAIFCANDYMAIDVMKELKRRGYEIPGDYLVVGFDDIRETANAISPLTTVRQPLAELGTESVKAVLSLIEGRSPGTVYLPAQMVVRRSCGCKLLSDALPSDGEAPKNIAGTESCQEGEFDPFARILQAEFPEIREKLADDEWAPTLIRGFNLQFKNGRDDFSVELESRMKLGFNRGLSFKVWYRVVGLIAEMFRGSADQEARRRSIDRLTQDVFELIGIVAFQLRTEQQRKTEERYNIMQRIYHSLNTTWGVEQIKHRISEDFPELNINSFYLTRYEGDDLEKSKLYFHFSRSRHIELVDEHDVFPTKQLIPGYFRPDAERYNYIVLPIIRIGFALCEVGGLEDELSDTLIGQISTAIKLASLMSEVLQYAIQLENKVEERTRELQLAQQQLIATAHQAGMAEMAIGVLHNIGNIVNSVIVSSETVDRTLRDAKIDGLLKANELLYAHRDELPEFFARDERAKVLPEYYRMVGEGLRTDLGRVQDEVRLLLHKTSLIQEIIRTLQDYARGNEDAMFQEKSDIVSVIDDALRIQEGLISKNKIKIEKVYEQVEDCLIQKAKLAHVIVNVVKNAAEAMGEVGEDQRVLTVKLSRDEEGYPVILIADTGIGIDAEIMKRIFTYGFTTKTGGYGFGLHTCANYMKEMGGSISAASQGPGKGAEFTIRLRA